MAKVLNNQTFLDLAMQECGNAGFALLIASAAGKSLTEDLPAGEEIIIPVMQLTAQEKSIAYVMSKKQFLPASNDDQQMNEPDGIGFMAIGSTFIIA